MLFDNLNEPDLRKLCDLLISYGFENLELSGNLNHNNHDELLNIFSPTISAPIFGVNLFT